MGFVVDWGKTKFPRRFLYTHLDDSVRKSYARYNDNVLLDFPSVQFLTRLVGESREGALSARSLFDESGTLRTSKLLDLRVPRVILDGIGRLPRPDQPRGRAVAVLCGGGSALLRPAEPSPGARVRRGRAAAGGTGGRACVRPRCAARSRTRTLPHPHPATHTLDASAPEQQSPSARPPRFATRLRR